MEGALDGDEVVVVISGAEKKSDSSNPNGQVERIKKLESGSYSFPKYLQVAPPPATVQVAQLTDQERSLRSRKKVPTFTSSSALEIPKINPVTPQKVDEEPILSSRRSLVQSAQTKAKSRLVEPAVPSNWKMANVKVSTTASPSTKAKTPKASPPITPRTPLMASPREEEDDDDDVVFTEVLQANQTEKPAEKINVLFLIEFSLFVCITLVLILSETVDKLENSMIWSLELWKWCVLVLVIFCGRLCSEWFTNVVVFLIERNFLLKKKVLYFVYSLQKSIRIFIWLGLILLTWGLLINRGVHRTRNTAKILNYITRALASALVAAGAWILKTLFVKILASSFHVKRFFDRIQESIFHQYVLQTLSGPPLMEDSESINGSRLPSSRLSFKSSTKKGGEQKKEEVIDVQKLQKMKREKVSAWTMTGLIKVIRKSGFSTLSGAFVKWVVNVYKERKFLALSLNDTKTAIEELNKLVSGLLLIVLIIVWLLLMGFATTQVLLFISSQLLLGVFMFGNSAKTAFEAIIFVFVMHPFDVGDRCVIDGVQVIVEEVNILTTVFLRYDNEKIFYPNSILATKAISNFNRSPEMSDSVEFDVDVSTSVENILALKAKIKTYIDSKPQQWRPTHSIRVREIEDVNKMKMSLYVTHTINFQNYEEKSDRRSNLVLELKKIFEELGIKYHLLPQEVLIRYVGSASPPATTAARLS